LPLVYKQSCEILQTTTWIIAEADISGFFSNRHQRASAPAGLHGIITSSDLPASSFPRCAAYNSPTEKDPMTESLIEPLIEPIHDPFREFDWCWKSFDGLSALEVYTMLAARSEVFVVEQNCVYGDVDGQDPGAWHLLVYRRSADAQPALAGYLRVLLPNSTDTTKETEKSDIRIGRVLTTAAFRGIGLGQAMLERTLEFIREQWPGQPIRLHAQARLERFYAGFGFETISDVHIEDNIPHIWMRRT
jgi:ElaA protein